MAVIEGKIAQLIFLFISISAFRSIMILITLAEIARVARIKSGYRLSLIFSNPAPKDKSKIAAATIAKSEIPTPNISHIFVLNGINDVFSSLGKGACCGILLASDVDEGGGEEFAGSFSDELLSSWGKDIGGGILLASDVDEGGGEESVSPFSDGLLSSWGKDIGGGILLALDVEKGCGAGWGAFFPDGLLLIRLFLSLLMFLCFAIIVPLTESE